MIYQKLIIADQSYEVSCQDINFVSMSHEIELPCRENKSIREN